MNAYYLLLSERYFNPPLTSTESFIFYSAVFLLNTFQHWINRVINQTCVLVQVFIVAGHSARHYRFLLCVMQVNKQAAGIKRLVLNGCSRPVSQSGFIVACCRLRSRTEPVQCVPRPVRFSMAPAMILSAGSVTESCVILLYCVISIVALFMCPSLAFIAV